MPKILRTAAARNDYLEIYLYIAADNEPAAARLLESFDKRLEILSGSPGIGARRSNWGRGVRSLPVGNCLLIFRPVPEGVELLRVVHGARDLRRLFRDRKPGH